MNSQANTVRVADVARLATDERVSMQATDRLLHAGPYPLYAENCMVSGIDDYALEAGGTVLVGAYGQIIASDGFLMAFYEPGRCSATEHVHALVPHDPADALYLWRVLGGSSKAPRLVTGTSQLRQLGGSALLSVPIPWPERPIRDAFVQALDEADRRSQELAELTPSLLAAGDAAFRDIVLADPNAVSAPAGAVASWQAGTNVCAADRGPHKPVRVEGPHGRLGRCDEALACGPVIAVGPASRRLLAHYVGEPSHPIAEMRYVGADQSTVPLSVLFFALRAAGLLDRMRMDGQLLEAPQLSIDGLEGLPLVVGSPSSQEAFDAVGADPLERLAQAERDKDALAAERRQLMVDFIDNGLWEGSPMATAPLPQTPAAPQLIEQPGPDALGVLTPLVSRNSFGLEPADLAWELAPLAALRAVAAPEPWGDVARAAQEPSTLVAALDAAMESVAQEDDLLSFLPNLSYASSLLTPEQLAQWVVALDALDPAAIDGACVRAAFALEPDGATLPGSMLTVVEAVVDALASRLPEGWETAYVPWEACDGMVDLLGRRLPQVTVRAQFDDFAHALEGALVRATELRDQRDARGGLGAAPGNALVHDEFSDWTAPLVLASLPSNAGAWHDGPVAPTDPRWSILGTPPRNKANYAWIQHALSHQSEGGATVLLLADAALHSKTGSELTLRQALAASGRVRLVAAFPARLHDDGRAASALVVLGDPRPDPSAPCLMVNALGLGHPRSADPTRRLLTAEDAACIADMCAAWLRTGSADPVPGFARTVSVGELLANDGLLTPWTYTHRRGFSPFRGL